MAETRVAPKTEKSGREAHRTDDAPRPASTHASERAQGPARTSRPAETGGKDRVQPLESKEKDTSRGHVQSLARNFSVSEADDEAAELRHLRTVNRSLDRFDGADDGGDLDGTVSRDDVQAVAGSRTASRQEREAARYLLDNPDRMESLGGDDGKFSQSDLDGRLVAVKESMRDQMTPEERRKYVGQQARLQSDSLDQLKKDFKTFSGGEEMITRDSLQSAARDPGLSKEQRDAAQFLLDNPDRLKALDVAGGKPGSETDGKISSSNVDAGRIDAFNALRENPDERRLAEIEKQQGMKWSSLDDARRNLQENPDLSTYSKEQLVALDLLSNRDPALKEQLQNTTSGYINERTRTVDQIPEDPAFQRLLLDQVVDADKDSSPQSVGQAQDHLKGMLRQKLEQGALQSLDGKKGDDEARQALEGFVEDGLRPLAERNPALTKYFGEEAKGALEGDAVLDAATKVAEKDDNFLTKAIRWTGDKLGGLAGKAVQVSTDLMGLGPMKLGLDKLGLDGVSDFVGNVQGGLGRTAETAVTGVTGLASALTEHPIETAKGLGEIVNTFGPQAPFRDAFDLATGKSPEEVFGRKAELGKGIVNGLVKDYKKTAQQYGAEGAVAHVLGDVALAVATGGTSAEAQGGLKAGSIATRLDDLRVVARLKEFATTGRTGKVLDRAGDVQEALKPLKEFDNLSPALQSLLETEIKNIQKSAVDPTNDPDNQPVPR